MPRINTNPQLSVHDNYKIMNIINPYRFSGPENQFKFTIDTDLGDAQSQFTLPLRSGFNYNMIVYWGDGTSSEVKSYDDPNITHNYSLGGEYQISIQGTCQTFYFNNGGDKDKLTSIDQWGRTGFISMFSAFIGCSNLTTIDDTDGKWCSNVTTFQNFVRGCSSLTELDVSNWDTSNVITFVNFIYGTSSLTELDVSNWDTSNVITFSGFARQSSLTTLDVSNWDTSNVTNFSNFIAITNLTSLNVINWNVVNVNSFTNFALSCNINTTDYDNLLNNFASQNVNIGLTLDMGTSRYSIAALNSRDTLIDTYGWTINDGVNEPFQFTIDTNSGDTISSFTLPLRSGFAYNMTVYWGDGDSTDITAYDDSGITHNYATGGSYQITIIGTCQTFYFNNGGDKDKLISIDRWGNTFTDMNSAFFGCTNLTAINDTGGTWCSNVIGFSRTFRGCTSLTTLDVSNWNTSNVTIIRELVYGCTSLTTLNVSGIDVSNVNSFNSFIFECTSLTTLDVSNWNIANATDFGFFAYNCSLLTALDVSNWNTSNVTDFDYFL